MPASVHATSTCHTAYARLLALGPGRALTWKETVALPRRAARGWWGAGAQPVMNITCAAQRSAPRDGMAAHGGGRAHRGQAWRHANLRCC